MVEIEVAGFEHTHHLNTFRGFTMEGNRGGLYQLGDESLEGDDVHQQVAAVDEVGHAVEQGVHAEETLNGE